MTGVMGARGAAAPVLLGLTVFVLLAASALRERTAHASHALEEDAAPGAAPGVGLTPQPAKDRPESPPPAPLQIGVNPAPSNLLSSDDERAIVDRARLEIERVRFYDSSWMETSGYPMGDVPPSRGACTDVVVRSLREIGVDLQELVHEDIERDSRAYGGSVADWHIDHRRMSTMFRFFSRNATALTTDPRDKDAFRPGDIVFISWSWMRGSLPKHVAVVSDRTGPRGLPLLIENGGRPVESDTLGRRKIVGHFRVLGARR